MLNDVDQSDNPSLTETGKSGNLQNPHLSHSKWSFDSSSMEAATCKAWCIPWTQLDVYRCWWLCRAKLGWFRFNWSFCTRWEWWRMQVEAQWFLYWLGSVPDGFKAIPSEERRTPHPALPWLTSDTAQRIAGGRYCGQGCNALVHLCSNRSVCCMVYCPGSASLS